MSPFQTHRIVHFIQLVTSISILASAAFLFHYRTQNHSNFTGEPLVSCISGAVAFIYALWSVLNYKRQPEGRSWVFLRGLCSIVVCGLLIASSTLAFVNHNKEFPCIKFQDGQDPGQFDSNKNLGSSKLFSESSGREYENGNQYAPGEMCKNNYEDIDQACAILGVFAAIIWLADFCMIFGFCRPNEKYGPGCRRGRIDPDDTEEYYTVEEGPCWNIRQNGRVGSISPHEDYYDTLERRRHELCKSVQWTREGSKGQAPEPIPLSLQQSFRYGSNATDAQEQYYVNRSPLKEFAMIMTPDEAQTMLEPTFAMDHSDADITHYQYNLPTTPPAVALAPPPHPRTKWEYTPSSQARTDSPAQHNVTEPMTTSIEQEPLQNLPLPYTPNVLPSQCAVVEYDRQPGCIESPPGSSCYVFDSNQQKYLPSFVNMAARIEQKQSFKSVNRVASGLTTPTLSPSSHSNLGSPDEAQLLSQTPKVESEQKNQLNSLSLSPFNFNGSYFPTSNTSASPTLDSPKAFLKSYLNNSQLDQNQSPSGPTQQLQGQSVRRPTMTSHNTSELSMVILKNNLQNATANNNANTAAAEIQPHMSSPRSIYCGDF
ncbi:hypothetical protein BGX27_008720 [Mortierella sp. AM989]|nr:hypothetical protein BGX27_008720 [Mortierella sp. AM989]